MKTTRRSFLEKAAAIAVVSSGSLRVWAQQEEPELSTAKQIGRETMSAPTAETFEKWIGGTFRLSWRGVAMGTLVLARVDTAMFPALKSPESGEESQPETNGSAATVPELQGIYLGFKRSAKALIQETFTLDHDWLGTFDLLLVPSPVKRGPSTLTATITRMTGRTVPIA